MLHTVEGSAQLSLGEENVVMLILLRDPQLHLGSCTGLSRR